MNRYDRITHLAAAALTGYISVTAPHENCDILHACDVRAHEIKKQAMLFALHVNDEIEKSIAAEKEMQDRRNLEALKKSYGLYNPYNIPKHTYLDTLKAARNLMSKQGLVGVHAEVWRMLNEAIDCVEDLQNINDNN